jgi:general secretion pathway protein D
MLLIVTGTAMFAGPARAQTIALNQKRIAIADLIKQVAEATGRPILFDDSVRGNVSIVAKRPVTLDEAWLILDSSLAMLGFSILPSTEGLYRIAKVAEAVGESPFVEKAGDEREAFVTSLIPLRVATPGAVMVVLEPLAGGKVTLVALEKTNSLIASGPERSIARLTTIADALDHVDEQEVRYRVLRYRNVDEVAGWLDAFFESGALSRRELEIWTDERTNSLIYRGDDAQLDRMSELADRFDRPIEGSGRIQVLKVLNRGAQEIADLIQQLDTGGGLGDAGEGVGVVPIAEGVVAIPSSEYSIVVDEASRSLIVRGDPDTQAAIRSIVETLDEPPQLIGVDLTITEVRTPRAFSLNFAFSVPLSAGDDVGEVIARLISTPGGGGLAGTPSPETTLFGRVDQALNVPFLIDDGTGVAIPISNTGVITAGQLEAHTEVLLAPSLILTVGDTHEIFVGNNVPVPVSSDADPLDTTTADGSPVLSRETIFERRDVGIKVIVQATAGREGRIALDLDIEISRIAPSVAGAVELVGPTFLERKVVATALLNDGEAAVIAVNRDKRSVHAKSGTPFLSDLPFLGWLFTETVVREEDVRLVIGAQARRISSPGEFAADTIRRRLAFERRNAQEATLPTVGQDEPAYAVLVTTRSERGDAEDIARSLTMRGYETRIHLWSPGEGKPDFFDVYVLSLETMADAANVASTLNDEGWQTALTVLRTRS